MAICANCGGDLRQIEATDDGRLILGGVCRRGLSPRSLRLPCRRELSFQSGPPRRVRFDGIEPMRRGCYIGCMEQHNAKVFLVALDQELVGYRRFLAAWVYRRPGLTVVLDPGPRASIPHLVNRLRRAGIHRLDFVLLTHIHLDHGGGSAELLAAFPEARLWCHPRGRNHLLAPERLWQGSLATIGAVARAYGEPRPLRPEQLAGDEELAARGIEVIDTPGHAPHHASFCLGRFLFAGEAVATRLRLDGPTEYLRPATPPRFLPEVFLASLARLERLYPQPDYLCFAHYGLSRQPLDWYRRARCQLELWLEIVAEELRAGHDFSPQALVERLQRQDSDFPFSRLPPDIRRRELFYVTNTLQGLWQALAAGGS